MTTTTTRLSLQAKGLAHNAESADTVAEAAAGREAVLEPKLDGIRLLAHVTEDGVRMYSRAGNRRSLPEVEAELAANFPPDTWLDGEAVALKMVDGRVINEFGKSLTAVSNGSATYAIFDLIAHGGLDVRRLPFRARREALEQVFGGGEFSRVLLVPQAEATEENHAAHLAAGFEGSIVKHLDARYASGARGYGQSKLKGKETVDGIIIGAKPGNGSFEGKIGSLRFAQVGPDGALVERGGCSGMDYETRCWLTENLDALIERRAVIEIGYQYIQPPTQRYPHGAFRHPRFLRMRDDKPWEEVTLGA